jgi:hypothetical protein
VKPQNTTAPHAREAHRAIRLTIAAGAVALVAGCSGQATPPPRAPGAAGDPSRVEVWEGREPQHPFVEAGDLWARTMSKPTTLARLREEAARFYMDGIHAVECRGPLYGECTAVGFVYEATHQAGNAAPAARGTVASR